MDEVELFEELFVLLVKQFLNKRNPPQKALLILDNCPSHPHEDEQLKCSTSTHLKMTVLSDL